MNRTKRIIAGTALALGVYIVVTILVALFLGWLMS